MDSNPRSPCCGGARCSWRRATRVRDIDRVDRTRNKHAMPVSLKDILEAFEFVSADNAGEHRAFLCRQSGRVYWYVEYSNDELSELPEDIDDSEKYVQIPDKRELDLGKALVLEFVRQTLPSEIDKVQRIFSAKGAYATFKDLMDRKGALDQWYNFEAKAEEEALRTWCALNSIEISD